MGFVSFYFNSQYLQFLVRRPCSAFIHLRRLNLDFQINRYIDRFSTGPDLAHVIRVNPSSGKLCHVLFKQGNRFRHRSLRFYGWNAIAIYDVFDQLSPRCMNRKIG